MTYDNTDTNADGAIDAPVDNDSVSTNEVSNDILYADTPDEADDLLTAANLPPGGGTVKVKGGTYTDSDWSKTITIPKLGNHTRVGLDLSAIKADLDSFEGPYIKMERDETAFEQPVDILAPHIDVRDVTSPGTICELNSPERSRVYVGWKGQPAIGVHKRSDKGSGHMNQIYAGGPNCDIGIKVGDADDPVSSDRSFYYGQIGSMQDAGVEVANGQNNVFFVQPENIRTGAVGIRVLEGSGSAETAGNEIQMMHSGPDGEVFDIRQRYTLLRPPSKFNFASPFLDGDIGRIPIPPSNIRTSEWDPTTVTGDFDFSSQMRTVGTVTANDFGFTRVNAGQSDGSAALVETTGRVAPLSEGVMVYGLIRSNTNDAVHRFGLRAGSENYAELVADLVNNTNWRFEVKDSGTIVSDVDTGIAINTSLFNELHVHSTDQHQQAFIGDVRGASLSNDISTWTNDLPKLHSRTTVSGSTSTDQTHDIKRLEWTKVDSKV